MSLIRADHFIPQYVAAGTSVTNGATFIGPTQLLNGAASVTMQVILSNGAAGTLYAEGTNFDEKDPNAVWINCQAVTLAANGVGALVFASVDQLTGMHAMRIRFVPTAGGNILVAVNLRHYSH